MLTANNCAREVELGLFDGGENGKYNGLGTVKISKLIAMQNTLFLGTEPFIRV